MDHIKQSISWWCFAQGDMTIESMVRIAADIGYEAIELVEQEHWQVIKDRISRAMGHPQRHCL